MRYSSVRYNPFRAFKKFNPFKSKTIIDRLMINQENYFISFFSCLTGSLVGDDPKASDAGGFAFEFGIIDYLFIFPALIKFGACIYMIYMPYGDGNDSTLWQKLLFVVTTPVLLPFFLLTLFLVVPFNYAIAAITTLLLSPILILHQRYLMKQNALVLTTPVLFTQENVPFPYVDVYNKKTLDYSLLLKKLQDSSQWREFTLLNLDMNLYFIRPIYLTRQNDQSLDEEVMILGLFHLGSQVKYYGLIIPSKETKPHILAIQKLNAFHFSEANIDQQALNQMLKRAPLQNELQANALFTVTQAFRNAARGSALELFTKGTVIQDLFLTIEQMADLGSIPQSTYKANDCLNARFLMKNQFFQAAEADWVLPITENSSCPP